MVETGKLTNTKYFHKYLVIIKKKLISNLYKDLPLLSVNIPEQVVNQKVNKNDAIEVKIDYQ